MDREVTPVSDTMFLLLMIDAALLAGLLLWALSRHVESRRAARVRNKRHARKDVPLCGDVDCWCCAVPPYKTEDY